MKKEHLDKAKSLLAETSDTLKKLAECSFSVTDKSSTETAKLTLDIDKLREMANE